MTRLLWICLGGAAGTGARYLLSDFALRTFGTAFPYGTLLVNLIGSFVIGVLMVLSASTPLFATAPTLRLTLTAGVLGGFTTYSSFNYETLKLLGDGALGRGLLYLGATLFGCLLCGLLGAEGTRLLLR